MRGIGNFGSFNSFRRRFKRPRNDERDWKADRDERNYKAHDPVRNFQKWKYLGRDLNQQPADNRVGDRDFVDVAPFQLSEEVHFNWSSARPIVRKNAFQRGSL